MHFYFLRHPWGNWILRRHVFQSDGGMHWDDSGMNITVNPLDDVEKNGGAIDEFSDEEEEEETDGERWDNF